MHTDLKNAPRQLEYYPTAGAIQCFQTACSIETENFKKILFKNSIHHHTSRSAYFIPGNKPFIPLAMLISLRIFCPLNIFIIFCDCSNWFSILLTS